MLKLIKRCLEYVQGYREYCRELYENGEIVATCGTASFKTVEEVLALVDAVKAAAADAEVESTVNA